MSHYGKAVLVAGFPIIRDYFAWMRKFAKHPEKYEFSYRYKKLKKLLKTLSRGFNVSYHVEGLEKMPKETCCIIANHLSAYDPVALICALDEPCTFVAKKELEGKPFAGKVITGIEGLFLDRNDLKQSLRIMMKVEDDLKTKKDKNWMIFPEGTRNKDHLKNIKEFHHGTFRPAVKAGVPIVPVAVYGTFRVLKKKPAYKNYPVFIKIMDPIYPEQYKNMTTQDIALLCQQKIERAIDFDLRKKDFEEMTKIKKEKGYLFNKTY